jgi:hypothetical protein
MNAKPKPLAEVTREAVRLLYKEIGIVNTVRFLGQFTTGYGALICPTPSRDL